MKIYQLKETDILSVEGAFDCVGSEGGYVYVQSKEPLKSPFRECALPAALKQASQESLKQAKQEKLKEVLTAYEQAMQGILGETPLSEILTWNNQEAEAKAYAANPKETSAPTLKTLAQLRGVDLDTLCQKVLQKATLYRETSSALIGKRQSLEDKIQKASALQELQEIEIVF